MTNEALTEDALLQKAIDEHISKNTIERVDTGVDGIAAGRVPAVSGGISAEGFVTVYSMIDGRPSEVLPHMLRGVLRKKLPNGRPAFWVEGMGGPRPPEYHGGSLKCLLHPDHPMREELDAIGLAGRFCKPFDPPRSKANLATEMDVRNHMRHRHRDEWAVVEQHMQRKEREEDYQRQAEMIAAVIRGTQAAAEPKPEPAKTEKGK